MNAAQQTDLLPLRVSYNQACMMLGFKSRESLRRLIKQDSSFPRPIITIQANRTHFEKPFLVSMKTP